jgi:hypothetical protein
MTTSIPRRRIVAMIGVAKPACGHRCRALDIVLG